MAQNHGLLVVSEHHMMHAGLEAGGHTPTSHATDMQRFRDFFGCDPKSCSKLFEDLQTTDIVEDRIRNANLSYFLMTLYWLRGYGTETRVSGHFKIKCPKTFRRHVWEYTAAIRALKARKVSNNITKMKTVNVIDTKFSFLFQITWYDDEDALPALNNEEEEIMFATIDGVHCRIFEPSKEPSPKWYSHKFQGPAVTYEIVIHIRSQRVLWINGPFPAAEHDIEVARKIGGVLERIPPGKRLIGDGGYRGEPNQITTPNIHDSLIVKDYKNRARARHETFNKRVKDFQITRQEFRSAVEKHQVAFEAVCIIVQYDIENGHPLFEV